MGVAEDNNGGRGLWSVLAKPCDNCKSTPALLYCRVDSAFMCMSCDSRIHADTKLTSRHDKVWMCEVCEQAPASVNCKADAAALCVACDRDIHSANPLAQRHERTPVAPFFDTAESILKYSITSITTAAAAANTSTTTTTHSNNNNNLAVPLLTPTFQSDQDDDTKMVSGRQHHLDYAATTTDSWISSNPFSSKFSAEANPDLKSMEYLLSGSDPFLEFDFHVPPDNHYNSASDSVVPVQNMKPPLPLPTSSSLDHHPSSEARFEIDFTRSSINSYHHHNKRNSFKTAPSLGHSLTSSSLEVGVVPDGSSFSETSYALSGTTSGSQAPPASQLVGKDREARVLRYREKRKNRKFEKTIRYASRKAYAETRPRVKGRFAKRSSSSSSTQVVGEYQEVDPTIFISDSTAFSFSEARFGIVPSF